MDENTFYAVAFSDRDFMRKCLMTNWHMRMRVRASSLEVICQRVC